MRTVNYLIFLITEISTQFYRCMLFNTIYYWMAYECWGDGEHETTLERAAPKRVNFIPNDHRKGIMPQKNCALISSIHIHFCCIM